VKTDNSGESPTTNGAGKGPTPNGPTPNGNGNGSDPTPNGETPPTFAPGGPEDPATTAMRKRANGCGSSASNGHETTIGEGFTMTEPRKGD
jgi:hypothetical protein